VIVVPAEETDVAAVRDQVAAGAGGVILFGSKAPDDLGAQLAKLVAAAPAGIPPLVMSDEEGGAVQRMPNLVGRVPSARTMGSTMSPRHVRRLATRLGRRLLAAGVTMDLAPVLDLDDGPGPDADHPIGTRSFSIRPRVATSHGLAFAQGLRRAGVVPVVKHFPGLGGTSPSTDVGAAETKPWSYLRTHGLRPFRAAVRAGVPAVMVANASVPGLTDHPAGLSAKVIRGVLRHRLGFDGLVVTDSLSAGAISAAGFGVPRATVAALRAGADLVLWTTAAGDVATVFHAAVGRIRYAVRHEYMSRATLEAAVVAVLTSKAADVCGPG
jgi:beta-N-acetylhexosaminidase